MRRFSKLITLLTVASLAACESQRTIAVRQNDGTTKLTAVQCVGVLEKGKLPGIDYNPSARNIIVSVFTVEFIAPPVITVLDELYCPASDTTKAAR